MAAGMRVLVAIAALALIGGIAGIAGVAWAASRTQQKPYRYAVVVDAGSSHSEFVVSWLWSALLYSLRKESAGEGKREKRCSHLFAFCMPLSSSLYIYIWRSLFLELSLSFLCSLLSVAMCLSSYLFFPLVYFCARVGDPGSGHRGIRVV